VRSSFKLATHALTAALTWLRLVRPAIHYQVDLTGGPFQPHLSGLPNGEWLALRGMELTAPHVWGWKTSQVFGPNIL
jgi:hypothetical protein